MSAPVCLTFPAHEGFSSYSEYYIHSHNSPSLILILLYLYPHDTPDQKLTNWNLCIVWSTEVYDHYTEQLKGITLTLPWIQNCEQLRLSDVVYSAERQVLVHEGRPVLSLPNAQSHGVHNLQDCTSGCRETTASYHYQNLTIKKLWKRVRRTMYVELANFLNVKTFRRPTSLYTHGSVIFNRSRQRATYSSQSVISS